MEGVVGSRSRGRRRRVMGMADRQGLIPRRRTVVAFIVGVIAITSSTASWDESARR